jgi:hypothetical protein
MTPERWARPVLRSRIALRNPAPLPAMNDSPQPNGPVSPAPYSDASYISVPTPRTRALRTFVPWQLWRFVVISLRILQLIAKSHH